MAWETKLPFSPIWELKDEMASIGEQAEAVAIIPRWQHSSSSADVNARTEAEQSIKSMSLANTPQTEAYCHRNFHIQAGREDGPAADCSC